MTNSTYADLERKYDGSIPKEELDALKTAPSIAKQKEILLARAKQIDLEADEYEESAMNWALRGEHEVAARNLAEMRNRRELAAAAEKQASELK